MCLTSNICIDKTTCCDSLMIAAIKSKIRWVNLIITERKLDCHKISPEFRIVQTAAFMF